MSFWRNKNVLVTGATGFLGFWLIKKLVASEACVVALIRDANPQSELYRSKLVNKISTLNGSLESYSDLERALVEYSIDTVFHLGAQTIVGAAMKAPLLTFETNIRGTYNLLEACRRQQTTVQRIIIASSDKAYGSSAILPYTEQMPLNGLFPYDVSKSCCDLIAKSYAHTYDLPVVIARCGNLFGGADLNWSRLIPGSICSLLRQQSPIIRSDGTFTRDYLYIFDAINAYLSLAENLHKKGVSGEAFNFGPSKPHSVLEIIHLLQDVLDCHHLSPHIDNTARSEIKEQFLSSKKAKERLGWEPEYEMREALRETVDWYRDYLFDHSSTHQLNYALC